MRDGPAAGLAIIDGILARGELAEYHFAYAARADLCRRLGQTARARQAYQEALNLGSSGTRATFPRTAIGGIIVKKYFLGGLSNSFVLTRLLNARRKKHHICGDSHEISLPDLRKRASPAKRCPSPSSIAFSLITVPSPTASTKRTLSWRQPFTAHPHGQNDPDSKRQNVDHRWPLRRNERAARRILFDRGQRSG